MPEADTHALPGPSNDTWRAWLMTGVRRQQGDKRRIRGAHLGLKRMLVEGMKVRVDNPYSWKEFSDALVRQAVGDAVRSLSPRDAELVKLAYFGGLSNREISATIGMPQATIERRLRRAIATVAEFVERGRGLGQRALGAVAIWLSGRWFHDAVLPAAQATVVAGMAAVMVAQAPAAAAPNPGRAVAPGVTSASGVSSPIHESAPEAPQPDRQPDASNAAAAPLPVPVPATSVPVSVPVQVPVTAPSLPPVPPLPSVPVKIKPPQL
ncbi:MAG TPA: sigma-70 family RNA polymerase sigma factor [Candidatus Dormibacteraeota bacterium]|nr:sigma-70 family RNA polymerase sigma factor [Candidatus Dormibacteraeota bacterium]